MSASMQFVKYGAKHGKEHSGAYLFLPDGAAKVDLDTVESHLYCHLSRQIQFIFVTLYKKLVR